MSNPTSARARATSGAGTDPLRRASTPSGPGGATDTPATSSAASSQVVGSGNAANLNRADQIVHRFYLKTVGVLVDGRVTHVGAHRGERKKDRWFNLSVPDTDMYKTDLRIYRAVSSFPPLPEAPVNTSSSTVPPLLVAFILDTNDIPAGQTLLWNRDGARVALDPCLVKQQGPGGRRPGIVLERWTLRVTDQTVADPAMSEMAPPTAYRLGIIHFRALYAFIRLLPAYRLFRRLRRLNTGLRLGIKLWGPEGYPNAADGLAEAWSVMERDLVGLDVPLEHMITGREPDPAASSMSEHYDFPPVDLFGSTYELGVVYRPNTDFDVEDMESVLSERFVDMDEEWFTPTVARHRLEAEARAASQASSSQGSRAPSQQAVHPSPSPARSSVPGSSLRYEAGAARPSSGSTPKEPSSLGAAKWGALADNLPFAAGVQGETPPSPSTATGASTVSTAGPIPYRRLSAHSLQPFRSISASPSTSILRNVSGMPSTGTGTPGTGGQGTPSLGGRAIPGLPSQPMARTSSFLSQSGRSLSHAQLATMQGGASASPPVGGGFAGSPPYQPSGLSFSKQAIPRYGLQHSTSSPFGPASLDRESPQPGVSPGGVPTKRYSSSSLHRRSIGSSPQDPHGLPPGLGQRRTSTRESGLRHSLDEPRTPLGPDNDDVHAFLRALDSWTPPPSLAPHHSPRATAPSQPSVVATAPTPGSEGQSPAAASVSGSNTSGGARVPLTRTHVDDMLKRMAGSFGPGVAAGAATGTGTGTPAGAGTATGSSRPASTQPSQAQSSERSQASPGPSRTGSSGSGDGTGSTSPVAEATTTSARPLPISGASAGLLSASRPPSAGSPRVASLRGEASGSPSSLGRGSLPRTGSLPRAPALASTPEEPSCLAVGGVGGGGGGGARSLPAGPTSAPAPMAKASGTTPGSPLHARPARQSFASGGAGLLSPQTTGGSYSARRGPVLVRGGFGAHSVSSRASTSSSSPSHSPVREYRYRSGLSAERERSERDGGTPASGLAGVGLPAGYGVGGLSGLPPGPFGSGISRTSTRRTAPSSLGAGALPDDDLPRHRGRVASEGSVSPLPEGRVLSSEDTRLSPRSASPASGNGNGGGTGNGNGAGAGAGADAPDSLLARLALAASTPSRRSSSSHSPRSPRDTRPHARSP